MPFQPGVVVEGGAQLPVSPIIGRSRSSQLISSEGLEGYGRGSPREEVCRELLKCIRRCKAC